ncbi:MAG TPA: hypothetical protein VK978_05145 [Candidatus Saccharimonadales bacterium]|nr:hypothetical protein [Candidatus Saccharimonadales bacterium]
MTILYRPNSEHARAVESFVRDFARRYTDVKLELVNIDSRDGAAMASLYDIMQYPGILALAGDGVLLKSWQGPDVPMIDEVASYAHSA